MLAQCLAEADSKSEAEADKTGKAKTNAADELQAMIEAQKAKIAQMKARRNKVAARKLPTTEEEALAVIRNENVSQTYKDCLNCIKEARKPDANGKLVDCAKLCGFGMGN